MGQIIIPTEIKVNGPWLLDNKGLEELNNCICVIEMKLEEAFKIIVNRTAESKLEEYKRYDDKMDLEKAKQKVSKTYPFEKSEKYALLLTKQGKKIKDDTVLSILKNSQINDFHPTELRVQIEKGPCEFSLEISSRYDGELESRVKVSDDEIFNDINYEINKWIEKHKPNVAMQKWSSWFPWAVFPIIVIVLLWTPSLLKSRADLYKSKLSQESFLLLKDGLNEQEATKAIEIILQQESGYIPDTFQPDVSINNTIFNGWLIVLLILIILLIKPKTVIGIGKNKWKVIFYRKWTYFVLVFVPLSIVFPIIRGKLF
jgi:hypothetical protein